MRREPFRDGNEVGGCSCTTTAASPAIQGACQAQGGTYAAGSDCPGGHLGTCVDDSGVSTRYYTGCGGTASELKIICEAGFGTWTAS